MPRIRSIRSATSAQSEASSPYAATSWTWHSFFLTATFYIVIEFFYLVLLFHHELYRLPYCISCTLPSFPLNEHDMVLVAGFLVFFYISVGFNVWETNIRHTSSACNVASDPATPTARLIHYTTQAFDRTDRRMLRRRRIFVTQACQQSYQLNVIGTPAPCDNAGVRLMHAGWRYGDHLFPPISGASLLQFRVLFESDPGSGFDSRPVHCQPTTLGKYPCASVTKQYNLVPAKGRWCSATGLASHSPCGTDFSGLCTYGLTAKVREMSTPWSALPYLYLIPYRYSSCSSYYCCCFYSCCVDAV